MDSDTDGMAKQEQASGGRTELDSLTSDTTDGGRKPEESTDKESPRNSDAVKDKENAKDKEKKKETSRFFSSPKMRGAMFPFDQISVPMSSHRQKNIDLHKIFSSLDNSEKLIDDYSCALQRDILVHGRLYVTQNWLCFYANIFTWETLLTIPFMSVMAITKERTAFVFPNAIQINTTAEKYGFSSLMSRDAAYNVLFKVWQNSLLNEHLTPLELVKAARKVSGDSAKVATAEDLWGADVSKSASTSQLPKATASLPAVLPTHVEIIPKDHHGSFSSERAKQSGESPPESKADSEGNAASLGARELELQLPRDGAKNRNDNAKGESPANSAPRETTDNQTPPTPMTPGGGEFPERVSIGGESLGSYSEFETVSFADETGEIPCGCSEHVGRTIINDVYATDVETIFQLLFTDANFFRDFLKARNTINIDIGEWQEQTDSSRLRDLNYTVALNYSFGPKFSPTIEHQVYSSTGQPGLKHLVHTEVMNRNIPYADTFFVSCQYCLTRVAHDKTRLRITANINFRKSCWGVVKNLIEKNAGDGVRSFYNHLDTFMKEHLASLPPHFHKRRHKRQKHTSRARHRRTPQLPQSPPPPPSPVLSPTETAPPSLPSSPLSIQRPTHPSTTSLISFPLNGSTPTEPESPAGPFPGTPAKKRSSSFPQVNMALTLLLGILIVSNMALYHHLMSYQSPGATTARPDPLTEQSVSRPALAPSHTSIIHDIIPSCVFKTHLDT
jgi:hypothetical protein